METANSFGHWVRRQRKARDLTQQALADQVGCSLAAIKKIEQDERRPSRQIAGLLADVLGVPASQREIFLEVARGVQPVDQLALAHEPAISALPTGIVTFLFTDIEDSTKLAQEHPDEWEMLRARHHGILRETMEAHHGYVFQVIGDAFCVAFDTANDALQAAIVAQRKLQTEHWGEMSLNVRMGIHTGEAQLHGNEYHGYLTLSHIERLMSAGHGGQILLSHATESLLRGHLPRDVSLLDLGEQKFKNILQPVRVFQAIAPDLQEEFPALRAQGILRNNLPVQLTSFIGREKEITEIIRLLEKARLVTLTGPGGTGKTRLAIQVANELLDQYPNGVWMVELAPILDPMLIPRTTAIAIGLRDEPHRPVIDMLRDYLREKKLLLLLDNCEHLIEACAQIVDTLLHACPQIHILATSREAFGIAGETLYLVPSLTRPDIRNLPSLESLNQYEAIQLFMDRATSIIPTFTLTEENASSIAQICQHLDGIPLGIELAVGKIRTLSTGQIAKRLDDRLRLLTGGSRTALPRHQTLHAAIEWSYNLLSPTEQTLFRRLSVFVGGWTLEAAESICSDRHRANGDTLKAEDILELLTQLVNKSLVMTEERNGEVRYHMLETIRQFANEELLKSGEHGSLRDKHLEHFLNLAETAEPHLIRPEQLEWLARLDADNENLRTALEWSLAKQSPELPLRLCAALGMFWDLRGYWLEGSKWLKEALSKGSQNPSGLEKTARIRALNQDARLARQRDDIQCMKASAERSFALAQESTDPLNIAIARFYVGRALSWHNKDEEARLLIEQSLTEFQALKHPYWEAYSYSELSKILVAQGSLKEAERNLQNLQLARKAGERSQLAQALVSCAYSVYSSNQVDEARKYAEEAEILGKQIGFSMNNASFFFAELAWISGDYERAKSLYMRIQEHSGLLGEKNLRSAAIADLGVMTLEQGDIKQAQAYIEESLAIAREIKAKTSVANRLAELATTIYFEGNLEKCKRIFKDSIVLTKEIGSARIRVLLSLLDVLCIQKPDRSAPIFGAIDSAQKARGPLYKHRYERAKICARQTLGDKAFNSAFAEGQKLSLDEALDLALKIVEEM